LPWFDPEADVEGVVEVWADAAPTLASNAAAARMPNLVMFDPSMEVE
jgi:hypothetical protein